MLWNGGIAELETYNQQSEANNEPNQIKPTHFHWLAGAQPKPINWNEVEEKLV